MGYLLKSALYYYRQWKVFPIFLTIRKKPLQKWRHLYLEPLQTYTDKDIVETYNRILKSGGKPAAVALLPSSSSKVYPLDIDKVVFDEDRVIRELLKEKYIVAKTPRGGLRIIFFVKEPRYGLVKIKHFDERIGEGGIHQHLFTVPPGAACIDEECKSIGKYYYVLGGRKVEYPWMIPRDFFIERDFDEAVSFLELLMDVKIIVGEESPIKEEGALKLGSQKKTYMIMPCWENLDDFKKWLEYERFPPLPKCVEKTLTSIIPHGSRYIYGAATTIFLAFCVADKKPEELLDYIGEHLEDYPADTGEQLNTKLSRLLAWKGKILVPVYRGFGFLDIDPEDCVNCVYRDMCRKLLVEGGKRKYSEKKKIPEVFALNYWTVKAKMKESYTTRKFI